MATSLFISDTHFFHDRIIEFSKRPFNNIREMNEQLIENWNEKVGYHDIVYHIGDFALGNVPDDELGAICDSLNGTIHLVPGNHDTLRRIEIYNKHQFIIEPPLLHLKKQRMTLCHFPMRSWFNSHHGEYHLHGHTHGALQEENALMRRKDVGVDANNFYPVSYEEVVAELKERKYYNHHTNEEER